MRSFRKIPENAKTSYAKFLNSYSKRILKYQFVFLVIKAIAFNTIEMPIYLFTAFIKMPTSAERSTRPNFDYASLDAVTASFVQQQTGQIRILMRRTAQDIVEIGQRLASIKEKLGHGYYLDWLETEFDGHRDTASKFMQVAKEFGDLEMTKISTFEISALYRLAAPSTPQAARDEAIARAAAGESITYTTAKQIRHKHTPNRTKSKPPVKKTSLAPTSAQPESTSQPETVLQQQSPTESTAQSATTLQPQSPPEATSQPETILQTQSPPQTVENLRPKQEILIIRPKETIQQQSSPSEQTQPVTPKKPVNQSSSIQAGSWWQIAGQHLLFCGSPNSSSFQLRLPQNISLQLAFPPERNNWLESVSPKFKSALCLWSSYQDSDLALLRELVEKALLLYTEGNETTVFLFMPDPQLLLLAHELGCQCMIAEPDLVRCQTALRAWQMKGMKIQQVKTLRF